MTVAGERRLTSAVIYNPAMPDTAHLATIVVWSAFALAFVFGAGKGDPAAPSRAVVAGDDESSAEAAERNYLDDLNPDSKRVIRAFVEPALADSARETRVQFERHGYFVADLVDHAPGRPVFNRAVTLKDSWNKPGS
jgi:hypothetical protein